MTRKSRIPLLAEFRLSFLTFLAAVALTLLACSDENLSGDDLVTKKVNILPKMQNPNNRVDMEEAMSQVEKSIVFLDKEHPSESRSNRMVNSVSVLLSSGIKSSMMKSGEYGTLGISDTLAYVFNFKDSLGYVIISYDRRVGNPLFAFTEKGSLFDGKTDNPGLKIFLERLEGYLLESIIKSNKADEPITRGPTSAPLNIQVSPLVPVEWGQGMPFNNYVGGQCNNNTGNNKYWAGCVATATAQIMSYWKYPTFLGGINIGNSNIGGTKYNWTMLNNYKRSNDFSQSSVATNMVADLFQKIGKGVNMNYGCDGSGSHASLGLSFLVSNGFKLYGSTYLRDYDLGFVHSSLTDRRPLIARGCNVNAGGGCHAWVIDGVATTLLNIYHHIHNNWGWDGTDNGYYYTGIFDPLTFNFQNVEVGLVYK